MTSLELKVPPIALVFIFMFSMWLVSAQLPKPDILGSGSTIAAAFIVIFGAAVSISGVLAFRQAQTTVNPLAPQEASTLVKSGVYRITRNPMYVGFLLFLIGFGIYLQSVYSLVLCLGFVVYMNRFQIGPEERCLEAHFRNEFVLYKDKVRRWI